MVEYMQAIFVDFNSPKDSRSNDEIKLKELADNLYMSKLTYYRFKTNFR